MNKKTKCFLLLMVSGGIAAAPETTPPVGKVLIYSKSNIDGSNEGKIAVYYRDAYEIESFKWHEGNTAATVVRAEIDPLTLNVRMFDAYRLNADGTKRPVAELVQVNDKEITGHIGDHALHFNIEGLNWHSYDFDFSSLAYAYRFLEHKPDGLSFDIVDINFSGEVPQLKRFGKVEMQYKGKTIVDDQPLLNFNIDGPGLDNRGGEIWFNQDTHDMYGLTIQKPDESSYDSNHMRLKMTFDITDAQWQEFKVQRLNPG